jgi:hypothetical protein
MIMLPSKVLYGVVKSDMLYSFSRRFSRVDLVDIKTTSALELRVLAGLPGTKTARSDVAALEPIALTDGRSSYLALVRVV